MGKKKERIIFNRSIGRVDVMALGFGTIVGWSWITLAGEWIEDAGFAGAILAFGICAAVFVLLGALYGELASALPFTGGEFIYVYRALGTNAARFIGWIMAFAYIGIAAAEAIALSTAFSHLFPLEGHGYLWTVAGHSVTVSWMLPGIVGALILTMLNYRGLRQAVVFQVIATAGIILVGLILLFSSGVFGHFENMGSAFTGSRGLAGVMLVAPTLLIGFSVLAQSSEEMNIPQKSVAKAMIDSILLAFLWYLIIIFSLATLAPEAVREAIPVPVADALAYAVGGGGMEKVVIFGGILGILTTWNGFLLAGTRILSAMSQVKILPPVFNRKHHVHGTPCTAVLIVGLICIAALLLGKHGLSWIFNLTSLCIMIAYLFVAISYLILKTREPDLYRPFTATRGRITSVVIITLISFYLFFYLFLWSSGRVGIYGWLVLAIWLLLGILLFSLCKKSYGAITPAEREYLMFGHELSRSKIQFGSSCAMHIKKEAHHEK